MKQTLTIARRELLGLFSSPIAYVVVGLFGMGVSLLFFVEFGPGRVAEMRGTFSQVVWLMMFLVPAISMRLISEEFSSGMIELLMTSPVTDGQVIVGKWLGAMGFLAVLMTPLALLVAVLEFAADPHYGGILTGLAGLLLVGGLYLAIGAFASTTNRNQIIAFLLTVFIIGVLTIVMRFLPEASFIGPRLRAAVYYLSVERQFADFNKGLIDLSNIIYFVTGIALFLFLATLVLQSKRWR